MVPVPNAKTIQYNNDAKKIFFFTYMIHCFICRPSDSIVSKLAGIEPRTVATTATTTALAVRRSNHSARSHPQISPKKFDQHINKIRNPYFPRQNLTKVRFFKEDFCVSLSHSTGDVDNAYRAIMPRSQKKTFFEYKE
jgi:hypothetical protein